MSDSPPPTRLARFKAKIVDLFGIDSRTLALFRLSIAAVILYDLATRALDLRAHYTDEGVLPVSAVREMYRKAGVWCFSPHTIDGSMEFQSAMFIIAAVLAVALLVGFRTRMVTVLMWFMTLSLQVRMPIVTNGGDVLLNMMLFWAMFLPLGKRWSIDAYFKPLRPLDNTPVLSFASAGILLQLCFMYFFTGVLKSNEVWSSGDAIYNSLSYDIYVKPFGKALLEYPGLLRVLTWGTLALELAGPFLLFIPWGTRYVRTVVWASLVGMHVGIQLTMNVALFSFVSIAALTLFLPASLWTSGIAVRVSTWLSQRFLHRARKLSRLRKPVDRKTAAPTPAYLRTTLRCVREVFCFVAILFLLTWNIAFAVLFHQGYQRKDFPKFVRMAEATPFVQEWTMFLTPNGHEHWYLAGAYLRNEEMVDVLRDGAPVKKGQPIEIKSKYPSDRWKMFYVYLPSYPHIAWTSYADFLARRWNETHAESQKIVFLELVGIQDVPKLNKRTAAIDDERNRGHYLFMARHDNGKLSSLGIHRDGKPHGRWIKWHANGQKSEEGMFQNGKQTGTWTFWHPDGRKEGEGTYRNGLEHGKWKFWHTNGTWSVAEFKHGERAN